jgi:hypothetical protein
MYQQLQNCSQGLKSVDEYTEEFHKLLSRVDLSESDEQLVSRYIGGLRPQILELLVSRPDGHLPVRTLSCVLA